MAEHSWLKPRCGKCERNGEDRPDANPGFRCCDKARKSADHWCVCHAMICCPVHGHQHLGAHPKPPKRGTDPKWSPDAQPAN